MEKGVQITASIELREQADGPLNREAARYLQLGRGAACGALALRHAGRIVHGSQGESAAFPC